MQLNTQPIHYKAWFESPNAANFRWLFDSISSLGYFIRTRKDALINAGLIEVVPTRGYFIHPEKFTEDAIKPFFIVGSLDDDLKTSESKEAA